jgi:segregation and condensation protein A
MKYIVKTNVFEGPLAVMYEMIEKRSLSVSELSMLSITEDFIDYVKSLNDDDKAEIANFINVASVLILLKSKSLLPADIFEDEDRSVTLLESQLKAYGLIKSIVKDIKSIWGKEVSKNAYIKNKIVLENIFLPDPQINIDSMQDYIKSRLHELVPLRENRQEVRVDKKIKIEDALSHVRALIGKLKNFNFNNIHNIENIGDERLKQKTKKNVVILFLSLLELIKLGEINVEQENSFGDIIIQESIEYQEYIDII